VASTTDVNSPIDLYGALNAKHNYDYFNANSVNCSISESYTRYIHYSTTWLLL